MIEDFAKTTTQRRRRRLSGIRGKTPVIRRRPSRTLRARTTSSSLLPLWAVVLLGLMLPLGMAFLYFSTDHSPEFQTAQRLKPQRPQMVLPEMTFKPLAQLTHTVSRGETLGTIFAGYGLPMTDAQAVHEEALRLAKEEEIVGSIRRGQALEFYFADDGQLEELRSNVAAGVYYSVKRAEDGSFQGTVTRLPKHTRERVVAGAITNSFAQAANAAGLPYDGIDSLVDLFSDRIAFHRDFRKGDRFTVIYHDTVLEDGTSVGSGAILAAALEVNGQSYFAVRFKGSDGVYRHFNGSGELLGNAFLRYPLKFSRISSHFSKSRFHPVLKRRRPHNGVDFAAPTGTPVRSVSDGRVIFAGRKGGGGLTVKIQHTERYSTAYLHLSKIAKGVRKGARVKRGQQIGAVGMTGLATGPHLHYSFYDRGKYVDPLKIKLPKVEKLKEGQKIDPVYLKRVLYTLNHYQRINLEEFYWN